ncbi:MAG: creatininase family protein [Candidatus Thorarchaeota archaeon]|nr:creatininase family protein [Candidatus Thorarchaeota archaeon]
MDLTNVGFTRAMRETEVAVMQTGAVEAHGTHLPLGTDIILPQYLAGVVATKTNALVLPPIPFGDSWWFDEFSGTVSVSTKTLTELYAEVMSAVFRHGFRYIVALNGHGGNVSALQEAAKKTTLNAERAVIIVNWWVDLAKSARQIVLETPEGHAAEDETSEVMHVRPELVVGPPPPASRVTPKFKIISGNYRQELYPKAVFGDPTKASAEKGRLIMEQASEELIQLIEQLQLGQLPMS